MWRMAHGAAAGRSSPGPVDRIQSLAVSRSSVRTLSPFNALGDQCDRGRMVAGKLVRYGHGPPAIACDGYTAALKVSQGTAYSMSADGQGFR